MGYINSCQWHLFYFKVYDDADNTFFERESQVQDQRGAEKKLKSWDLITITPSKTSPW
jgi:hypothetical protein